MVKENEWIEKPMIPLFFEIRLSQSDNLPNGSFVDLPHFGGLDQKTIIRPLTLTAGARGSDVVEGIDRYLNNDFHLTASTSEWSRGGQSLSAIPEFTLDNYHCRGGELAMDWLMEPGDLVEVHGTVRYEMNMFRKFYKNTLPTGRGWLYPMAFTFAFVSLALTVALMVFTTDEGWVDVKYLSSLHWDLNQEYPASDRCRGHAHFGWRYFTLSDTGYYCSEYTTTCDYSEMSLVQITYHGLPENMLCYSFGMQDWGFRMLVAFFSMLLTSFYSLVSLCALVLNARTDRYAIPLLVLCSGAVIFPIVGWLIFLSLPVSGTVKISYSDILEIRNDLSDWGKGWAWILSLIAFPLSCLTLLLASIDVWLKKRSQEVDSYNEMIDDIELKDIDNDEDKLEEEENDFDGKTVLVEDLILN